MRKSRAITLTVLSGLLLTGCCVVSPGCGRRGSSTSGTGQRYEPPDHTWYDANGNAIPEKWKTDEAGNRVLDAEGRPVPEPHVPYDRHHRPWTYSNGVWAPILIPIATGSSYSSSRSSSWLSGGSGYRSTTTTPAYRSSSGTGSSSIGSSSSSSISRGGFGSTGSSSSSSSSS